MENGIEDSCIRLGKFAQVKPLRCGEAVAPHEELPFAQAAHRRHHPKGGSKSCRKWRGRATHATFGKI
ncbi:hypothetical protein [Nostoc sp.]